MLNKLLARPLDSYLGKTLLGELWWARFFTPFIASSDSHIVLSDPIVFTGDFTIKLKVLFNSIANTMIFSGGTSTAGFELFLSGSQNNLSYRVNGLDPGGSTDGSYITVGELREITIERVGTTVTLSSIGKTDYVVTISGNLRINELARRLGVGGFSLDGILADVFMRNAGANVVNMRIDEDLGSTTVVKNTADPTNNGTAVNITSSDFYTFDDTLNGWLGAERVVNGDFSNGLTDWEVGAGGGWTSASGSAIGTNINAADKTLQQNFVFDIGETYYIQIKGTADTGGFGLEVADGSVLQISKITPTVSYVAIVWIADRVILKFKRDGGGVNNATIEYVKAQKLIEVAT